MEYLCYFVFGLVELVQLGLVSSKEQGLVQCILVVISGLKKESAPPSYGWTQMEQPSYAFSTKKIMAACNLSKILVNSIHHNIDVLEIRLLQHVF